MGCNTLTSCQHQLVGAGGVGHPGLHHPALICVTGWYASLSLNSDQNGCRPFRLCFSCNTLGSRLVTRRCTIRNVQTDNTNRRSAGCTGCAQAVNQDRVRLCNTKTAQQPGASSLVSIGCQQLQLDGSCAIRALVTDAPMCLVAVPFCVQCVCA